MLNHRSVRKFLWMVPLLFFTLACNAVAQFSAFHQTDTIDLTSLSPSRTSSRSAEACTALLADILEAATSDTVIGSLYSQTDGDHQVHYLVVYDTHGDELGKRVDLLMPEKVDEQIDSPTAQVAIWRYFTSLIPAEARIYVTEFSILSDGPNNILAGVSPTYDNPSEWTLKVDAVDAGDPYSITYSLLHEYGHLLTLNATQVPPDELVFYHPNDKAIRDKAATSCPRYFTGEGCSNAGSYMNEFFNRYWNSIYSDWQDTQTDQGQEVRSDRTAHFYRTHEDQFLTSYAATSPEEDMAEAWAFFVLSPKPESTSIASQKILFFYDYPELVALRQQILDRLCKSFPGN